MSLLENCIKKDPRSPNRKSTPNVTQPISVIIAWNNYIVMLTVSFYSRGRQAPSSAQYRVLPGNWPTITFDYFNRFTGTSFGKSSRHVEYLRRLQKNNRLLSRCYLVCLWSRAGGWPPDVITGNKQSMVEIWNGNV